MVGGLLRSQPDRYTAALTVLASLCRLGLAAYWRSRWWPPRFFPGALFAFALSFDEVIVTVFIACAQNTLPWWILGAIRHGQQLPEVNAVVSVVILLTIVPVVVLAARIAGAGAVARTCRVAAAQDGAWA